MNVNKGDRTATPRTTRRVRRTPQAARDAVLKAARARLLQHGVEGLKITAVARDAGMSHATLLHHFGSSDAMRRALIERMAGELLGEFIGLIGAGEPSPARLGELFRRLFAGLSDSRHAQLFAWFALSALDQPEEVVNAATETRPLVEALLQRMSRQTVATRTPPRYIALLVVAAAIGLGVAGPWLKQVRLLLQDDADVGEFAQWFAEFLLAHRAAQ
jgi:AcrR family transcriptional regulator